MSIIDFHLVNIHEIYRGKKKSKKASNASHWLLLPLAFVCQADLLTKCRKRKGSSKLLRQ